MKRALPYIGITAAFLVVALIVNGLVAWGTTTATSPTAAAPPRAWFVNPLDVNKGVPQGHVLRVMIRLGDDRSVAWLSVNERHVLDRGIVLQTRSGKSEIDVPTANASPGTWLYVRVDAIKTPLSVRIT